MTLKASPPPFYMIRHGETDWNREGRYQGQVDIPLNDRGREQAAGNGRFLATLGEDWSEWRFFASPLGRARETMEIIRREIELPAGAYATDAKLVEISYGDWERQRIEDLRKQIPEIVTEHEANKWDHAPPGGESYSNAVGRVETFLGSLTGPSVIVCHGGILRVTRHLLEGLDGPSAVHGHVPQDRVYRFDGTTAGWMEHATA